MTFTKPQFNHKEEKLRKAIGFDPNITGTKTPEGRGVIVAEAISSLISSLVILKFPESLIGKTVDDEENLMGKGIIIVHNAIEKLDWDDEIPQSEIVEKVYDLLSNEEKEILFDAYIESKEG